MSVLVGTLAVDVVNGQATFTLDDAKSQLDGFGKKAAETGERVSFSMRESRESVMAVSDMFGVHLPASLTRTVAGLETLGPALAAALPFAAIAVGAVLLFEHIAKVREEAQKLAQSQIAMGTTVQHVFDNLDDKILSAGIKADELTGNHLGALQKKLELIDHQSMHELAQQFDIVAGAAEKTLSLINQHWYESKIGVVGVKDALENFKAQYASLLAQKDEKGASDLLAGTLQSAIKMKELMTAQQEGHGSSQSDLDAQNALIGALNAQVGIQQRLNTLKQDDKQNTTTTTNNTVVADSERLYKAQMDAARHAAEEEERIREETVKQDLAQARGEEQETIKLTVQGSQARIAAIDAAIKREQGMYQTYTEYYKGLVAERARAVEQEAQRENAAAAEGARHQTEMAKLAFAQEMQQSKLLRSAKHETTQQITDDEKAAANSEYDIQRAALQRELDLLSSSDANYLNKKQQLMNRETELEKAHQNQLTQIDNQAQMERNKRILSAETQFDNTLAKNMTDVLTRHQTFGKAIVSIGSQVVSGMIENALKSILADDMTKERDAAYAARQGFKAGTHFPWPLNMVMPEVLAATFFASTMAFAEGGVVPGVGTGDSVSAMLTPGEGVLTKPQTQLLKSMGTDSGSGATHYHAPAFSPTVHAMDAEGVDRVLTNHKAVFQKHFHSELRKMSSSPRNVKASMCFILFCPPVYLPVCEKRRADFYARPS